MLAKKLKKAKKLSASDLELRRRKRSHRVLVSSVFKAAGFQRIKEVADHEFTFKHVTSDFDDCFVYSNVIVFLEYTVSSEDKVGEHVKGKQGVYSAISQNMPEFIEFIRSRFPAVFAGMGDEYSDSQIRVRFLYCSLNSVKLQHKLLVPSVKFFDFPLAQYFRSVSRAARHSARFELFDFLGFGQADIGEGVKHGQAVTMEKIPCSILPEDYSNFGEGFKVVTFYMSPASLLPRACVLRRYGWREGNKAYQRIIRTSKIASIRQYLRKEKRVFVNNIIATLPSAVRLVDDKDYTVHPSSIHKTTPGNIQIPFVFNSIGIIDGQHRIYAYHEGGDHDADISKLRNQQNLLVTGIIFPDGLPESERLKFEAKMFLEINSTQATARSQIRQEIKAILEPFSDDSIARRVIALLNDGNSPLQDTFQRNEFERNRMKTASVVSFALKGLISKAGPLWAGIAADIRQRLEQNDEKALEEYVEFCADRISEIFFGFQKNIKGSMWTADRKVSGYFLNTKNINAVLVCLRYIGTGGSFKTREQYVDALKGVEGFDTSSYGSSKYNAMGEALYNKFFKLAGD